MENITKSIVYGNSYENKYGRFMPICSSIADRGIFYTIQPQFNTFWTTSMILRISTNITELHMPTESNRCL